MVLALVRKCYNT